jgi:hypothetical protein
MAVVANLVVKEDRKADRQNQAGQASIDHDHDGRESSLALSMALSQPPTCFRLDLSHSMTGQAPQ